MLYRMYKEDENYSLLIENAVDTGMSSGEIMPGRFFIFNYLFLADKIT